MICIVDYGMGNLRNVMRACREVGAEAVVSSESSVLDKGDAMILPGVGAFGEAMKRIDALGLRSVILDHVRGGRPLLGICLGMQILFERSDESPGVSGLGVVSGSVEKFSAGVKIPHIGWNDVSPSVSSPLFRGHGHGGVFYFVHSYFVGRIPETVALTAHGVEFSASIRKENIYGVQFHPEKSQAAGLAVLRRFAELSTGGKEGSR
jgi:glutamine amidotransferase